MTKLCRSSRAESHSICLNEVQENMPVIVRTTLLLLASNVFMTFAWYAHLRNLHERSWYVAALASWGIALFEYLLQVPANRIGYTQLSVAQLKITQEVITLSVFAPFAVLYMRESLKWDYLWAGLCLLGAVYFMFRS
jgi:uncharacterized protein (DUF486 family)